MTRIHRYWILQQGEKSALYLTSRYHIHTYTITSKSQDSSHLAHLSFHLVAEQLEHVEIDTGLSHSYVLSCCIATAICNQLSVILPPSFMTHSPLFHDIPLFDVQCSAEYASYQ